jgi:hypothetical protein
MIRYHDQQGVWEYLHDELGLHFSEDFRGCIWVPDSCGHAIRDKSHVSIAVGFNGFIGRTCAIHTVIKDPAALTRQILREVFSYPFIKCGLNVVMAPVDSVNTRSMEFVQRLGFTPDAVIPNGGLEGDLVLMQMTKANCRWIKEKQNG